MPLEFGVFDHIEPVPGLQLDQIYRDRLAMIERLESAGFFAYHLAEHHTPAVHSLAPSQNVFLAAAAQRTKRLRLGPWVYLLPLYHPLRLIEEISMLDNLSDGRLEIGIGRGGLLEAYFWGLDSDAEANQARYRETLDIILEGLSHDELTYHGRFYTFDELPMRLRPKQSPHPPLWYMRNIETAAIGGMSTVILGSIDGLKASVPRYRELWEQHQGVGALTPQGTEPKIGLVVHAVLAETDEEAVAAAEPAWEVYRRNLSTPRRLQAEKRGLVHLLGPYLGTPPREERRDLDSSLDELEGRRRATPGGPFASGGAGMGVMAGSPDAVREYMDEYLETGANYFACLFQWGNLSHDQAMRSVELFATEVMPRYLE